MSEVNPNASIAPRKSAKLEKDRTNKALSITSHRHSQTAVPARVKSTKWSTPGTVFHGTNTEPQEGDQDIRKEDIEYRNKDNSKLRRFLSERDLSTHGTREELITRLENSMIDYESLTSATITEMLRDRHVRCSGQGNKEYKIERLRINDEIERDTGNSEEGMLYGSLSAMEMILGECFKLGNKDYSTLKPARLSALLEKRKLAKSGSAAVMIRRLQNDDRKSNEKHIKYAQAKRDQLKLDLESKTGRSMLSATEVLKREGRKHALEHQLQQEFQRPLPTPVCDYDWEDSHWADRTERQLSEICSRRGMPGYGPKAAMIKWLDTGDVDYEDMYITGLHRICLERGLKFKSGDKKAELVRLLQENDDAQ